MDYGNPDDPDPLVSCFWSECNNLPCDFYKISKFVIWEWKMTLDIKKGVFLTDSTYIILPGTRVVFSWQPATLH